MRHLLLAMTLVACGTEYTEPSAAGPDAGAGSSGYARLVDTTWTLPAATEKYLCVRQTVTTDVWIRTLRPVSPIGTHHSVLMTGAPDQPDGVEDCDSSLVKPAIYASGLGSQDLDMPDGVAIHLEKGDQLLLNLHLFNPSDTALTGTSGIEIGTIDPAAVVHEAGVVLAGKAAGLVVPPNTSTQTGTCTTPAGATIFALAPHMHLLGTHMKVSYQGRVVMDQDYAFDEQRFQMATPAITTVAGGKYVVECTYTNHTGAPVYFGEHTAEEMCFALTFVYPPPAVDECTQ